MTTSDLALLVLAAALVALAAFLAMAEIALAQVSTRRVEEFVKEGRRSAAVLSRTVQDRPRAINVLLLVRVFAEVTATVLVAAVLVHLVGLGWRPVLGAVLVMTVVTYVVIGVGARTLGLQHADRVSLGAARLAFVAGRVLGPVATGLIALGNALTPGKGFREGPFASEAELRDLVDLAEQTQVIQADQSQMLRSVFDLGDTIVREVMVPRTEMVVVERSKTVRQALSLALRSGFSRIPVVDGNEDDVVGVVYVKDLARRSYDHRAAESTERVERVMRQATFVPDSKPVDELLKEMQAARTHIAIVVDEFGGTAGLVTIEDILEEIVGEIADEYDQETPEVEPLGPGQWRVSARLHVDDFAELADLELDDDLVEDVDTIGGLLAKVLGKVPIPGAQADLHGYRLTAESSAGRRNRITAVHVARIDASGAAPAPPGALPALNGATRTAAGGGAVQDPLG